MANKRTTYKLRLEYLGSFCQNNPQRTGWFRDFLVPSSITLETLQIIIQKILGWYDEHLYVFRIKGRNCIYFGLDEFIVEDLGKDRHVSCHIPLHCFDLQIDENFSYLYDFGDKHKFVLTVRDKEITESKVVPRLLSFKGQNISQYPGSDLSIQFDKTTPKPSLFDSIHYHDYNKPYKWTVRFIQEKDARVLENWRKSSDRKRWEKAVVILDSWNVDLKELSEKIERPLSKIQKWIDMFNQDGLEAFKTKPSRRNRPDLSSAKEVKTKRILEILHQKPNLFGINRSSWNLECMAYAYEKEHGSRIGKSTIGHLIRDAGYRMKRAKRVLTSPDPNYREKVQLLLTTLHSLKASELLFFIDEMGPIQVKKHGGRLYVKNDETPRLPKIQRSRGSVTLFGALSATTNQLTWSYGQSKDTSAMIDLIEILFNQYHDYSKLYITWDAASWHSSNELTDWLDRFNLQSRRLGSGPLIEFIPLPTSSQFIDVIEAVFSGLARAIIHHSDYRSEKEMKTAISRHVSAHLN